MTNNDREDYSIIPDHPDAESANNPSPQDAGDERSQFNAAHGYAVPPEPPYASQAESAGGGEWGALSEAYYKAANALHKYRERRKLAPGTRVRCQYKQDPPKMGEIAPYGDQWGTCSHTEVPVLLDAGYCQRWSMGDIVIAGVAGGGGDENAPSAEARHRKS